MLKQYSILERRSLKWVYLFLMPTLVLFILFYLVPIITVFYTSFTKWDGFNQPVFNGIDNYLRLFNIASFRNSLSNLGAWSFIAMTLHVGFGVLVAFLLFQKLRGWKFVRAVFMIPNVISVAAWAMIYRFIFNNDFGLLNSIIRVFDPGFSVNWFFKSPYAFWAVTFTWLFYAVIVTLIVLGDLMAIPKSLHEAADIDGAKGIHKLLYIDLPLCKSSIGTGIIISITSRIAMYEAIALTTRGGPGNDTMNLALILVKSLNDYNYGLANATAMLMFLFGILVIQIINKVLKMGESYY